jgi:hypothetical protein
MKEVLEKFSILLRNRLGSKILSTEDSIRYTFFAALLKKTNIASNEIIFEYPHPKISGAKIDTYIPSTLERRGLILEFKYDREIPSGKNSPRPQKAGKLFNDIYRLTKFDVDPRATLWFIYLTDSEMATYLRNERNGLVDFFELPFGSILRVDEKYISSKSSTFQGAVGGFFNADIKSIWTEEMPNRHMLRIYEISTLINGGSHGDPPRPQTNSIL